jgi:hypothetical protein
MLHSEEMQVESAVANPEQIYARVFREMKPRTACPRLKFRFENMRMRTRKSGWSRENC